MQRQVLIRVDASSSIGLGHLVRCLSLGEMLRSVFEVVLFIKQPALCIIEQVADRGFHLNAIENENDFLHAVHSMDIVVLDGYHFGPAFQLKIKNKQAKLVYIDDLHEKDCFADMIINHVPGVKPEAYMAKPGTAFLLGPDYALLRPLFLRQARKQRIIKDIHTALICLGGSDYKNLTAPLLRQVINAKLFRKIIVVTGAAYSHHASLQLIPEDGENVVHYTSVTEAKMLELMLEAEVAIVSASGVLYEALAAGNLIITGQYVENQAIFLKEFSKCSNVMNADDFSFVKVERALKTLPSVKYEPSTLIDGKSGERILQAFTSLHEKNSYYHGN